MDGFEPNNGVIVMAATNLEKGLDPALVRAGRFDRHVAVPLPDIRGRVEILQHYLQVQPCPCLGSFPNSQGLKSATACQAYNASRAGLLAKALGRGRMTSDCLVLSMSTLREEMGLMMSPAQAGA